MDCAQFKVFSLVESCSLFLYVVLSAIAGIFAQCPVDIGCDCAICRYDKVVKAANQISTIKEEGFSAFSVSNYIKTPSLRPNLTIGFFFLE